MHLTEAIHSGKTVPQHKPTFGKSTQWTLTIRSSRAHPSIRLNDLCVERYRIADDPTADLRVPGLTAPITVEKVLLLTEDGLGPAFEIEFLGETVTLDKDPVVIRTAEDVCVVITQQA